MNHVDHTLIQKAKDGDAKARLRLVETNRGLVMCIVKRFHCDHMTTEDLLQEGICGILKAIDCFDLNRDVRFMTYAAFWVKAFVSNAVRKGVGSSTEQFIFYNLPRVEARFHLEGNHNPTREELANRLGVAVETLTKVMLKKTSPISLNSPVEEDMQIELIDTIAAEGESPEDIAIERIDRQRDKISEHLEELDKRSRHILTRRFVDEETLETVGRRLGITRERVRQLEAKALRALRRKLGAEAA